MLLFVRHFLVVLIALLSVLSLATAGPMTARSTDMPRDSCCQEDNDAQTDLALAEVQAPSKSQESDSEEDPEVKLLALGRLADVVPPWPPASGGLTEAAANLSSGRIILSSLFRPPRA